jgi:streptogramin lyase/mono/diheme cytochrome c family protein
MSHYSRLVTITVLTSGLFGVGLVRLASRQAPGASPASDIIDRYQRSYEVLQYNEVATSGVARGETIYFYKCWMCHQKLAGTGFTGGPGVSEGEPTRVAQNVASKIDPYAGPPLKDLFKQPTVTNEQVAAKIKNGGPRMVAYGHTLTDADVADLISYMRSPTCCYENEEPPKSPHYKAETHPWPVSNSLRGGARGAVKTASGSMLEGTKVQLIAPNAVRTTVFTDAEGRYEFPAMQAGSYTLRIATPAPFRAYTRENVSIKGASTLEEIVLEPIPRAGGPKDLPGALPPAPEVMAELSGAEMLWNFPGTFQQKATFAKGCAIGCHSYELIFRNHFDQHSWGLVVDRMLKYRAAALLPPRNQNENTLWASATERDEIITWLTMVRGPDSTDGPMRMFPTHPTGAATRVVITEYEANRRLLNLHDVCGDANGNIWYTSHHSPYIGYLDPRTGIVKEYKLPPVNGQTLATHACRVDMRHGLAWFSAGPWPGTGTLNRLDIATGEIQQFTPGPVTTNFGLAPDGFLWMSGLRVSFETGKVVNEPSPKAPRSYQTAVSNDGRFVAGGSQPAVDGTSAWMLDVGTGKVYLTNTSDLSPHGAARGGFDPFGNAWFGGHGGPLVEIVNEIDKGKGVHTRMYYPPTPPFPFTDFYTATPDKNGEVWGGLLHGRGFVRFNPKTEKWTVYENPEPSSLNRYQWIDNSTTPPTIWYPDFETQMFVRIQPLE